MSGADTVRGLVAAMEAHDWAALADYLSDDFVISGPYPQPTDKDEFIAIQQSVKAAFPDWKYDLSDIHEEGDKVRLMLGSSGTQTRVFTVPGVGDIAPTGRLVTLPPSPAEYTLRDGKVAALHIEPVAGAGMDGALAQLGVTTTNSLSKSKKEHKMAQADMQGKVCLVTGATSGIGYVTALELAKLGATVVMVGRNRSKGEAAQAEIKAKSHNDKVDLLLADLSVQADIRRLADEFKRKYDRLHVLVNNAGGVTSTRELTADGYERNFAVNHLAYFLLTNLLLDVLKASAPARVVSTASEAQSFGRINFDDLMGEKKYGAWAAYGQSKLANIMFTYELARRLQSTGVTANVLHPGLVRSGFGGGYGGIVGLGMNLLRPFSLSPERGAQTIIYLASSPEVEGVTGKYWSNKKPIKSNKQSYDVAAQHRLWQVSEQLTGLAQADSANDGSPIGIN